MGKTETLGLWASFLSFEQQAVTWCGLGLFSMRREAVNPPKTVSKSVICHLELKKV